MQIKKEIKINKGFAVLFSVMLASFLITLGISIFSISLKEIQITTSVRDSQVAYYAADSARECALYSDVKLGLFPPCYNDSGSISSCENDKLNPTITCNGIEKTLSFTGSSDNKSYKTPQTSLSPSSDIPVTDFFKYDNTENSPRADVVIYKEYISNPGNVDYVKTTIKTYGHNTGVIGRRVERGIQQINNQ